LFGSTGQFEMIRCAKTCRPERPEVKAVDFSHSLQVRSSLWIASAICCSRNSAAPMASLPRFRAFRN
jgi:hypothetical protein